MQPSKRKSNRREDRACIVCGVIVSRVVYSTGRTFCSSLCRRWTDYGAWSSPVTIRLPKPVKVAKSIECAWCCEVFETSHAAQRFCSHDHKVRARYARKWATRHGATGTYTWGEVVRLWVKFDRSCAYCRVSTPLDEIQAEHVVALAAGGSNSLTNILPSCGPCNANKRHLSLVEWAEYRAKRGLPPVVTDWDSNDPRYAHLVLGFALESALSA
jgi:endogenous inhibitor of DNA gyrase (YacG/DUF329 family)